MEVVKREIGEVKRANEIGLKGATKCVWHACIVCGKERWTPLIKGKPRCTRCHSCSVKGFHHTEEAKAKVRQARWKGGRIKTKAGYIKVYVQPDDFFRSMADARGYVYEHRLVMAQHLGRNLLPWEIVHHKDGVPKDDNRKEGLQLVMEGQHQQITLLESRITRLEQKVLLLEADNILLREQLNACPK